MAAFPIVDAAPVGSVFVSLEYSYDMESTYT